MSLSIQKMVSDGTLSTIVLGVQYLQRNDVYVRIAGVETPQSGAPSGYTWSFLDNNTIRVLPVVPVGVEVVVYRRTDLDAMYNIYSQNAQFDENTIDENNQQLLYIAQEYFEQGIPAQLIDDVEYVREDTTNMYYRLKLTDGSYTAEFPVPKGGAAGFEALRRTYLEAGLNLVGGSFETGGVLGNTTDVLLHNVTSKAYAWSGVFPKVVADGSTPGDEPGMWVDKSTETLRYWLIHMPFGSAIDGVIYRPGTNYESAGTVAKPETRPWYHDFRPLGTADGGDAVFSTDGANMFMGPGAGNFTMRPLAADSVPPGVDYNLQCSHNIAYGIQAMGSLTIGYKNSGFGTNAFRKLTSGHGNTASGRDCGHELTTGNDNSFYGFTAAQLMNTGNYNCVFGVSASYKNTDGSGNSVYGRRAAFDQTAGDYNQFFGEQAGYGFLSGSYNTFIGKLTASTGLTQGDSNLVIGSRITGLQDEKAQVIIADGAGKKTLEVHKDPTAAIKKASYLDLPSYEVTAFNATATDGQVTAGSSLLLRSLANVGNTVTQIVFQSRVGQPFSRIVSTAAGAGQMVFINDNVERLRILSAGGINPGADNTQPFGSASKRWSEMFAGTGTINTSDAREKTAPLAIDDAVLDAWGDVQLIAFQWLSSVAQKGDSARWHFGVIAQQVRDAFIARGLDGTKYGLLCYDEWDAEFETDEKGNSVQTQVAGNRWGIRPDQCLFLEAAYQRRRCDRIEARLALLESK